MLQGDSKCVQSYNMLIVFWVSTTVLYGCHSLVAALVTWKAHNARQVAKQFGAL